MTGLQCWKKNGCIQSCRHPIIHYPLHLPGYLLYLLLLPSSTGQDSPVLGPMFKKTLLWLSSKGPSLKVKEATPTQSPWPIFLLDLWLSDLGLQNGSIRSSRNLLEMQIFGSQSEPLDQKLWRMDQQSVPSFNSPLGDSACTNLDQTLGSHTQRFPDQMAVGPLQGLQRGFEDRCGSNGQKQILEEGWETELELCGLGCSQSYSKYLSDYESTFFKVWG